jgi:hypothetical protein
LIVFQNPCLEDVLMKTRAPLALALAAGFPAVATAQEAFVVSYSWTVVFAGTLTPAPNFGDVDPGQAARIRIAVQATINGTSAVGQTTSYTAPSPGGVGTVRGLGSAVYDLVGDGNAASANGTWGGFTGGFAGPMNGQPFNSGLSPGTAQPGGSSVHGMGGAQFLLPGQSANGANTNVQIFHAVWQPASYAERIVNFVARGSVLVPTGQQNSLLFAYGLGTDPGTGENFDLLAGKYIPTVFGNGLNIPINIIPSPSGAAVLGLGCILAGRRRNASRS